MVKMKRKTFPLRSYRWCRPITLKLHINVRTIPESRINSSVSWKFKQPQWIQNICSSCTDKVNAISF